jgi:hypothetical protein
LAKSLLFGKFVERISANAEKMLVEPLETWLKDPPEYDPEGWALSFSGEF